MEKENGAVDLEKRDDTVDCSYEDRCTRRGVDCERCANNGGKRDYSRRILDIMPRLIIPELP